MLQKKYKSIVQIFPIEIIDMVLSYLDDYEMNELLRTSSTLRFCILKQMNKRSILEYYKNTIKNHLRYKRGCYIYLQNQMIEKDDPFIIQKLNKIVITSNVLINKQLYDYIVKKYHVDDIGVYINGKIVKLRIRKPQLI